MYQVPAPVSHSMGQQGLTDQNLYLVLELLSQKQTNLDGTGLVIVPARMFPVQVPVVRLMVPVVQEDLTR